MNKLGKPLIIIGAIIVLIALNMDTTVQSGYGRVNNIGLIAERSNYLFFGALLFVAGLIINNLKQNNEVVVADTINCPFCAEIIKKGATLCKHCKSEIKPLAINPSNLDGDTKAPSTQEPKENEVVPLDKSLLNSTYTEEINSTKNEQQIRDALASELSKIHKAFNRKKLSYVSGETVLAEALIKKIESGKFSIKVNYQKDGDIGISLAIFAAVFIYSIVSNSSTMTGFLVIAGPIILLLRLLFSNKFSERKIKSAINKIKESP